MLQHFLRAVVQRPVVVLRVAQRQRAVTAQVDAPDLDVGLALAQVVLARQRFAQAAVTGIVVDGRDLEVLFLLVVVDREQAEIAHQLGAQILADEALVLEVAHRVVERLQPVSAGDRREPLPVFLGRRLTDALDVGEHREAQRIRVDAAVGLVVDRRLVDHVGVRLQPFDHHAIAQMPAVVHRVEQVVVPERCPTFIHHLRLPLRVEILRDLAHDAHHLALPGFEQRGVFLDEVQQVFLRFFRKATRLSLFSRGPHLAWQRAPHLVDLSLRVGFAVLAVSQFLREALAAGAAVAVDAVVHQRVAAVEQGLDRVEAVLLLALGDVVLGIDQVVDDRARIGPHAKQVVALEEAVVAVGGVRDHQRLHRHRVLLHQVADAGVGVDDDLVGQAHRAAAVVLLGRDELLAVAPVAVVHRHADRRIGIHHLLGSDDLELVRVGVEAEALGRFADHRVVLVDRFERPVVRCRQPHAGAPSFLNRSRNTG